MIDYLAAVDTATVLAAAVTALLSGSLVAAFAAYRKAGPEREEIIARTAIQVNAELRAELKRRDEVHAVELAERDDQIARLRERVAVLEARIANGQKKPDADPEGRSAGRGKASDSPRR